MFELSENKVDYHFKSKHFKHDSLDLYDSLDL